jgi:hypothetical protein
MKIGDAFRHAKNAFMASLAGRYEDQPRRLKGDVFMELRNAYTGALEGKWERPNIVTLDASILIARLVKDSQEPPEGAFVLAVGSGDIGWNPLAPPAATNTQRALYAEITRKTFASTQFIDGGGAPVAYPTNVVDFTTTYTESEAVGPLVEMGLIGGNISSNLLITNPVSPPNGPYDPTVDLTTKETLVNYLTFAVISKPATSTFTVTWRLTF